MKHLLLAAVFFVSSHALALRAPGGVVYSLKGELKHRKVMLVHEAKGEHKGVYLVTKVKDKTKKSKAKAVKVKKANNQTIIALAFNHPSKKKNTMVVFRGTLLRGKKQAMYYGDLYRVRAPETDAQDLVDGLLEDDHHHNKAKFRYVGAFGFHHKKVAKKETK